MWYKNASTTFFRFVKITTDELTDRHRSHRYTASYKGLTLSSYPYE